MIGSSFGKLLCKQYTRLYKALLTYTFGGKDTLTSGCTLHALSAIKWSLVYSLHVTFIHQWNLIYTSKQHSEGQGEGKTEREEEGGRKRERETEWPLA